MALTPPAEMFEENSGKQPMEDQGGLGVNDHGERICKGLDWWRERHRDGIGSRSAATHQKLVGTSSGWSLPWFLLHPFSIIFQSHLDVIYTSRDLAGVWCLFEFLLSCRENLELVFTTAVGVVGDDAGSHDAYHCS